MYCGNVVRGGFSYYKYYERDFLEAIWTFLPIWALFLLCLHRGTVLYGISKLGRIEIPSYVPFDVYSKLSYNRLTGSIDLAPLLTSIKIIGHQWYWEFDYMEDTPSDMWESHLLRDDDSSNTETPRLREVDFPGLFPVNCWVHVLFRRRDVVHSAFFPSLGLKIDCIPGKVIRQMIFVRR